MCSPSVRPAPSESRLFLGQHPRVGRFSRQSVCLASRSRLNLGVLPPTRAGIKLAGGRDGPRPGPQAPCTMHHAGGPRMPVAQTGAGGSGKGAEGRVQAWLRNGDRKGPAGGGVGASAASPSGPAAGAAAAVASARHLCLWSPREAPQTPTVCEALCWDPAGEEGPLWGPCSDLGRTATKSEPC